MLYGGSSSIVDTADGASPGCRGMPNFCLKGDLTTPIGRITMCFMDTSVLPPVLAVAAVQVSSSPSACAADVDGGTNNDDESGGDACRDCSSSMVDARSPPPGSHGALPTLSVFTSSVSRPQDVKLCSLDSRLDAQLDCKRLRLNRGWADCNAEQTNDRSLATVRTLSRGGQHLYVLGKSLARN